MEGHTWIYLGSILVYLYYLSRVFDRLSSLMNEKLKIVAPKTNKVEDRERWIEANALAILKLKRYRILSTLTFFLIPATELFLHYLVGGFDLTGQLMWAGCFVLFFICLSIILFLYRGRKSDRLEKKYTWKTNLFNRSESQQYQA